MNAPLPLRTLRLYRLSIPMRLRFEHAAAARDVSDTMVFELAGGSPYAHYVGYGETLARPYVTGETLESVTEDTVNIFAPRLARFRPTSFVEALEFIETLPVQVSGRILTAARAGIELALLDLVCRVYRRRPADVAGWMGLAGFGAPGCVQTARYSGEVVGRTRRKLQWFLRLQRFYGLADFKLKVAIAGWEDRLRWAYAVLRPALASGRATLRVDANAGWSLHEAVEAADELEAFGVSGLEQPLPDSDDDDLPYLAQQTKVALIADESVITLQDAERLLRGGAVRVFNLRLAKNGGLIPALRIARLALAAGVDVQLGCLVGETSILSAAGVAFLEACPRVRYAEGALGRWLLKDDVTRRSVCFRRGGRAPNLRGPGWGVNVDPTALERLSGGRVQTLQL